MKIQFYLWVKPWKSPHPGQSMPKFYILDDETRRQNDKYGFTVYVEMTDN